MNPQLRHSAAHVFVDDLTAPVLDPADEHHLRRVLRIRDSEPVSVSDGRGSWLLAHLGPAGLTPFSGVHGEPQPVPTEVWSAIPKGDRPELIVQKLTELGVMRIGWLHASRSTVRWDGERADKSLTRLRRVAREASMQSRRVWLPEVCAPVRLADLDLAHIALAEPGGGPMEPRPVGVAIGPEGGWTDDELASARRLVSFGEQILRIETAAIVAAVRLTG